jgi:hypothetical protein
LRAGLRLRGRKAAGRWERVPVLINQSAVSRAA